MEIKHENKDDELKKIIGARVREIRLAVSKQHGKKYSQTEFAKMIDPTLSQKSLSMIEKGDTTTTTDFIIKLYNVFGANYRYLLFGEGDKFISKKIIEDK